jgi:SAM-dependent methyltransferase
MLDEVVGYIGHRVHVVRAREVTQLIRWLGPDLTGKRVLDVAGGDGWWAGQTRKLGAIPYALDIDGGKLRRGRTYRDAPHLVHGDALHLPFADGAFDAVMSVCAIEHFPDGAAALAEMARVLRRGGAFALSADALTHGSAWPELEAGHRRRYHVVRTYSVEQLQELCAAAGIRLLEHRYLFRGRKGERLYLELSRGRFAWNAAAPLIPLAERWDRTSTEPGGSIVLVRGVKAG